MREFEIEAGRSVAFVARGWPDGRRLVVQNRCGMLLFLNDGQALHFFAQRFDVHTLSAEALQRRMAAAGTGPADPPTETVVLDTPTTVTLRTPEAGPGEQVRLLASLIGIALAGGMGLICAVHGDPVETEIVGFQASG